MWRYLSIIALAVAAALSASLLPQALGLIAELARPVFPLLADTRGQLSLVMLLVLCWSLQASLAEGFAWAFIGGITLDLLSVLPLGTSSAALLIMVYAINRLSQQLLRARVILLLAMAALATLFMTAYTYAALFLLGYTYDPWAVARYALLPTLLYNLVAVLPLYVIVRRFQRRLKDGLQVAPQSL
ncbi:MAG: rod shape-determining protein MreD [Chloroflexi bacterium]|nr:rod shape-determining protein MreD [Chloroflexota bacterium]MCY3582080.1 rod shape-determining protein MreD [Chloroflexota bacterium]MCY3715303.1 rod shape-determining protein MreD [Chloroflexota bacterium]MDE2649512.1 rod shape-determining protein MreD [Chloroflexota bacterium]MXV92278.1 rod shape-determining protein MreD [Chloroflexota bacterium]